MLGYGQPTSQGLLFNPEWAPGLETCWLQTFLLLLKGLGFFLPCKAAGFLCKAWRGANCFCMWTHC